MIRDVTAAYERFEFYRVYQRIYQFCAVDLSSFYLDVLKDRLYAEAPDGPDRRAAQFVLARLHDALTRLLAPIIPHTAEELWDFLPDGAREARERPPGRLARARPAWDDPGRDARLDRLRQVRDEVLRVLEKLRAAKVIGSSQEATVRLTDPESGPTALAERDLDLLTSLCIVSEIASEARGAAAGVRSRRDRRGGRAVAVRQVRAVLEPPPERRPGRRAPDPCDRCARVVAALPAGA